MKGSYYVINSDNELGIKLISQILEKNSENKVVAHGDSNMKKLAPLAVANKGRLTTYKADLSDPGACALFAKDAAAYSGIAEKLIFIFNGGDNPAEKDYLKAMQKECGSAYDICGFFMDKMEDGGHVVFIKNRQKTEDETALEQMSWGAIEAYACYLEKALSNSPIAFNSYSIEDTELNDII